MNVFLKGRGIIVEDDKLDIVVIGIGYVGLSFATLLAKKHNVIAVDINKEKVDQINRRINPIKDEYIDKYFKNENLKLKAVGNGCNYYEKADYIVIAVPTDYDDEADYFDCTVVISVIEQIKQMAFAGTVVIKSTVPVGFTRGISEKYAGQLNFLVCPEFLRESKALYDSLYPSRIVIGYDRDLEKNAKKTADVIMDCCEKKNADVLLVDYSEAEAIKLFSNTYLALRVSFFNELDTYAEMKGMMSEHLIKGVCMDPRIGNYYNNPSFGYGGYCLPKDTKQLLANYDGIPQNMMTAIVESNKTRKEYIANRIFDIAQRKAKNKEKIVVGVYRLIMKSASDNFRHSSIVEIIKLLNKKGIVILVYEPILSSEDNSNGYYTVENEIDSFKSEADLIVANRYAYILDDVIEKVYTRDLFGVD